MKKLIRAGFSPVPLSFVLTVGIQGVCFITRHGDLGYYFLGGFVTFCTSIDIEAGFRKQHIWHYVLWPYFFVRILAYTTPKR